MKTRLLFLDWQGCGGSRMAVACGRTLAAGGTELVAACVQPAPREPLVDEVLAEAGLTAPDDPEVTLDELTPREFDVVIVLTAAAGANLPQLPGQPAVVQWRLPLPEAATDAAARRRQLAALRDGIRQRVETFFLEGYLGAFIGLRGAERLILDCVRDGIFAHDLQQRILFFNHAAETITGISRTQALDRDCHDVFGGQFCSRGCLVAAGDAATFDERRQRSIFTTAAGVRKVLDTRFVPLLDRRTGQRVGMVVSFRDQTQVELLEQRAGERRSFSGIIGRDPSMQGVFDLIRDVADSHVPVLIQGESGTGKELVAAAIHNEGPRARAPFVTVNCGALPEGLLESELFGHVKGAFTGAIREKRGRFELANGGTIFLDEIGDVSPAMQVRLLRVLQDGVIQRVGGEQPVRVDVRVISATHRDLRREIEAGRFREDLYYRLNVVPVWLPPLRERAADIPLLVDHLLRLFQQQAGRPETARITPPALDALMAHDWPGNVRELQNWLQFALVKSHGGEILPEHLPLAPGRTGTAPTAFAPPERALRRPPLDVARVRAALAACGGERRAAARHLGVSRATLYRFFAAHADPAWSDAAP